MALPLYAITLFVSAFILFLVQPIVGKIILPKLGGTPQVWNTCMVFFQMVLLAGYAYTHNASTRLTLRQQLMAHVVLLILPLAILLPFPFAFGGADFNDAGRVTNPHSLWGFVPELGTNPIPSTLTILFLYVALPFVVVATTAPLLQKWFVYTGHPASKDPYFLYGASNLGSMLSLILYPLLIEPYLSLYHQGWTYVIGYLCLAVFVLACAAMVWQAKDMSAKGKFEPKPELAPAAAQTGITADVPAPAPVPAATAATAVKQGIPPARTPKGTGKQHGAPEPSISIASDELTFARRFRWVMLAAIPSSLMLGITTHITTDLSPIPLFWLIPLILYLGSFILVFMRWPILWTEKAHPYFLYAQPFCIGLMIMVDVLNLTGDTSYLVFAIFAHVLGFFTTTMACHGELAKDRPSTKHLTEFYLWMSVGGMLGGMFNGLIAPVVFKWGAWEFPLAIFAAAICRPKMFETGLLDNFLAAIFEGAPEQAAKPGPKGGKHAPSALAGVAANESLVATLDLAWPVVILVVTIAFLFLTPQQSRVGRIITYGIPLSLACLCLARPIRFGLGIGVVLLLQIVFQLQSDTGTVFRGRSYFGIVTVRESMTEKKGFRYRQLTHGHINHGLNYLPPDKREDRGNPLKDRSRLATTYYHREGPAGRVMEEYNWFKGPPNSNTYWADARMPANLVTGLCADLASGSSLLPMGALTAAWSEPPIATIGLGTGTMASYARVYQHCHFYEIDNQILRLSLGAPTRKIHDFKQYQGIKDTRRDTYFNYLENAIARGSTVQVLMGDARLRMALPYKNHYLDPEGPDDGGGPENFYHMMVVDAFSSDAIPAHLLTTEAFKMYFKRLTPKGILCVHTSNRFVDLPKVVAAISAKAGYAHLRGHDVTLEGDHEDGHYNSEWVMVARDTDDLKGLTKDTDFLKRYNDRTAGKRREGEAYWESVNMNLRYVWTDDYYNLLSVVRFRPRRDD